MSAENKTTARELLDYLYYESQGESPSDAEIKKLAKNDPDPAVSPERKGVETKLDELAGILGKLGIEDAKSRLSVCNGAFKLVGTEEQHQADSAILFDLTQISPLVDKGYVTVDAESDGKVWSVDILASDSIGDVEIPEADLVDNSDLEKELKKHAVPTDESAILMAEQLIKKLIG